MGSDKSQAHQSGNTSEDKVNKILETLPELEKLLSSLKEDPLGRRCDKKETSAAEGNDETETLARSQSAPPSLTRVTFDGKLITKLDHYFRVLKLNLGKLEQFQTSMDAELDKHLVTLQSITNLDSSRQSTYFIKPDLEDIAMKMSDLLNQVPQFSGKSQRLRVPDEYADEDDEDEVHQDKAYVYLPGIHTNVRALLKCEAFRQVKHKFMELDIARKICLLSFAVFPENREVHRTVLMYWWIGEGIIPAHRAEDAVRDVLKEFTEKNLVEPVEERRKVAPNSYKMTPFVHSSVIHLSKEIGLFDIYGGKYNQPSTSKSKMGKVCLVEGSTEAATPGKMVALDIGTVFNVSERYLDSTVKWFLKNPRANRRFTIKSSKAWFKSLNVLYLGRWERRKKRHIQVQNHELMKCLKHLVGVKLLSFQGISNIRSLSSSVCKLHQLIILDLRECYDLTELPEKIDSLQNLVYLDMTGCYMLEWVPLRLARLRKLEVLKGFVVSDALYGSVGVACNLHYLRFLSSLRKLSIEINHDDLGVGKVMEKLVWLKELTSLKVTWRRVGKYVNSNSPVQRFIQRTVTALERARRRPDWPNWIQKLSLQGFPDTEFPQWLHPREMLNLKELHIGGGREFMGFGDLPEEGTECTVEVLRLRSLPNLRVGWIELKELYFPKLTFLEKYDCPGVTLTPCDGHGIWRADQDC